MVWNSSHDCSLNAKSFAKLTQSRSSSTLSSRVYRVGVLAGDWEAMLECAARADWDTGRWAV